MKRRFWLRGTLRLAQWRKRGKEKYYKAITFHRFFSFMLSLVHVSDRDTLVVRLRRSFKKPILFLTPTHPCLQRGCPGSSFLTNTIS